MKKIVLYILIVVVSIKTHANEKRNIYTSSVVPQDTTILNQILALPLQSFIGKPVDSLFSALPSGYVNRYFIPARWGYIKGVSQGYGSQGFPRYFIQIFIDTIQFLPVPNYTPTHTWNMNLAKMEKIAFIKVWKDNVCVYGCSNNNYW